MAFSISPAVIVTEKDLTQFIPGVPSSITGMVGEFEWGPCFYKTPISSEGALLQNFGKPNDDNYEHWFSASDYLAYSNNLWIVRVVDSLTAKNAGLTIKQNDELVPESDVFVPNSETEFYPTFSNIMNEVKITVADASSFLIDDEIEVENGEFKILSIDPVLGAIDPAYLDIEVENGNLFAIGETVVGMNSGATGTIYQIVDNVISLNTLNGTFEVGEIIDNQVQTGTILHIENASGLIVGQTVTTAKGVFEILDIEMTGDMQDSNVVYIQLTGSGPNFGNLAIGQTVSGQTGGKGTILDIQGFVLTVQNIPGNGSWKVNDGIDNDGFYGELDDTILGLSHPIVYVSDYVTVKVISGSANIGDTFETSVITDITTETIKSEVIALSNSEFSKSVDEITLMGLSGYISIGDDFGGQEVIDLELVDGDIEIVKFYAKYPGVIGNKIRVSMCSKDQFDNESPQAKPGLFFKNMFLYGPQTESQYAIVVEFEGEIVERHIVSLKENDKDYEGNNIYITDYLDRKSNYISGFYSGFLDVDFFPLTNLEDGNNGSSAVTDDIVKGYDLYKNAEEFDVNLIIDGANNNVTVHQHIIDNIVEYRKDCMAILTPPKTSVFAANASLSVNGMVSYVKTELFRNTNYAAMYGNWVYRYDKYNDKYRWVPISGNIAGVYANSDYVSKPWMAPAGFTRGKMKNVIKFAVGPDKGLRDVLAQNNINSVLNFRNEGAIVYDQLTLQSTPSAFRYVDVRRLFLVLEKAIASASKFFLQEKNTSFTRRRFIGMVEPYLREVQGGEGIYDFFVKCDGDNNTSEVIANGDFIADIFIQPTISARVINLNFIGTKQGVNFEELISSMTKI